MGFFAILIALLLEQARPLAYDNVVHAALRGWSRTVRRNLDAGESSHGWVAWSLAVGVPALTVALVHWGLWWFSSVLAFAWMVAVLFMTAQFPSRPAIGSILLVACPLYIFGIGVWRTLTDESAAVSDTAQLTSA